jgi:hypothetical protein
MTYQSVVEMSKSESLIARVAACAAEEGFQDDPMSFARNNIWQIIAAGNWDTQWDSAQASGSVNDNPDTGARNDVVTDGMILSVVQPMLAAPEQVPEAPPTG